MFGRSILRPLLLWCASLLAGATFAAQEDGALPRDAKVQEALERALAESPDGTDFAETASYRDLVAALLELKPGEVEALGPATIDDGRALADPAALRGTWVRARGYVTLRKHIALPAPIGEVVGVERAMLKLDNASRGLVCDLVGDPPPFKKQADTVEVAGVFFRLVSFDANSGKRTTLPYVLVRSMELVDTPGSGMVKSLIQGGGRLVAGAALGLLGVLLFVFYLRHSARTRPDHQ